MADAIATRSSSFFLRGRRKKADLPADPAKFEHLHIHPEDKKWRKRKLRSGPSGNRRQTTPRIGTTVPGKLFPWLDSFITWILLLNPQILEVNKTKLMANNVDRKKTDALKNNKPYKDTFDCERASHALDLIHKAAEVV